MNQAAAENSYDEGAGDELAQQEVRAAQLSKLNALSQVLSKHISEAIAGREATGIEREWQEDEEFYEGIDDANRNQANSWRSKPAVSGSTFDAHDGANKPTGSTVFPNITRPYVDAAAARTADMLLPTDDVSWRFDPTPVPELIGIADGKFPKAIEAQVRQDAPGQEEAALSKLAAGVKQQLQEAREASGRAEKQIQDWHVECQYHAQVRSVIEDTARIGHGVLKGPVPVKKRRVAYKNKALVIQDDLKPASYRLVPENFFPDPGCGEDIQNGSYAMDRDDITAKKLESLKDQPGFFADQIEACLKEGPQIAVKVDDNNRSGLAKRDTSNLYEIWYYYGQIAVEDYESALQLRMESEEGLEEEAQSLTGSTVYIHAVMVNGRIIRVVQNHLDTGEFPYDVMVWQRRANLPYGIGIARQVRTAQRVVIAGWRNMMDNAGKAAGPQVLVNDEYVVPENGIYEFEPWKIWRLIKPLDNNMRMDQVFGFIKVEMLQTELAAIIEMGLRMAEDSTGLPMIMQGQTNSATPDTVGGMQLQENNAGTVLRRVARLFDDRITEPHVRRYYTYLLQYSDDDSAKGDFTINAMGSSALVERAMQSQNIIQLGTLATNPMYGIDPKKWAAEFLKSLRLDATRFEFDDGQWEQIVQNLTQPQADPRLEAAKIREDGQTHRKELELASRESTEAFKAEVTKEQQAKEHEFQLLMEQFGQDVTAYQEQMQTGRVDQQLKVRMAETAAKLKAQIQLNAQTATPAMEPAGRAPDGEAFQK